MKTRVLPVFLSLLWVVACAEQVGGLQGRKYSAGPFGEAFRQADAKALKWNSSARLYKVELRLSRRNGVAKINYGAYDYVAPGSKNNDWQGLQVSTQNVREFLITATPYAQGLPAPPTAPARIVDPLEAFAHTNYNEAVFAETGGFEILLTQTGNTNVHSLDSRFGAEAALRAVTRPGQWVWSTYTSGGAWRLLAYVDAETGHGEMVCSPTQQSPFRAANCPLYVKQEFSGPRRRVNR
jgi:hypothetical protein